MKVGGFVIVRGKMVDRMSTSPIYKLYTNQNISKPSQAAKGHGSTC
jgi:hypothetical protein